MIIHDIGQRTDEWFRLRRGMPTASKFKLIVTSSGEISKQYKTYAITLAGEKYSGKSLDIWGGNDYTKRGTLLEPEAASWYEIVCGDTDEIGFITDDSISFGCSPDRISSTGLVEIKCLKAENHISEILKIKNTGQCPADFYAQIQGQLLITGKDVCDLVLYHPDLPSIIHPVPSDFKFQSSLKAGIKMVIEERDSILNKLYNI